MADLHVLVRQFPGSVPEVLGAWTDRAHVDGLARELGDGHFVTTAPLVDGATGFVAHVWECRARVEDQAVTVAEPRPLHGASRVVFDTADVPPERVHVDRHAAELDAAVTGRTVHYVTAWAPTAERARELAAARAEELRGTA
ncbi:hypothetical protein [Amycolatopsis sp. CA-230715]|uniref:hypothetical protein n=1 Tax=Amycolatopsis sp. CA-230715 TaxID=2745196 RepID=UPI001C03004E|nr:hypothetical protein [Amycolatopsis sp. CA-230715]